MTSKRPSIAIASDRALCAAPVRGVGFDGQYWYWFSAGVLAAGC
ncbi:hypothetical protein [Billgrantia kenyensis]|nr:hypothetical protein [Halomonas kenyensis]